MQITANTINKIVDSYKITPGQVREIDISTGDELVLADSMPIKLSAYAAHGAGKEYGHLVVFAQSLPEPDKEARLFLGLKNEASGFSFINKTVTYKASAPDGLYVHPEAEFLIPLFSDSVTLPTPDDIFPPESEQVVHLKHNPRRTNEKEIISKYLRFPGRSFCEQMLAFVNKLADKNAAVVS